MKEESSEADNPVRSSYRALPVKRLRFAGDFHIIAVSRART